MPVLWRINHSWKSGPNMKDHIPPQKLKLTTRLFSKTEVFTEGLGNGIYSAEQINEHNNYQKSEFSRGPVMAKITNAGSIKSYSSTSIGVPAITLSSSDITSMQDRFGLFFFPLYGLIPFYHHFVMICLMSTVFKFVAASLYRIYNQWRERGFGPWLFFCIVEVIFGVFRTPVKFVKAGMNFFDNSKKQTTDVEAFHQTTSLSNPPHHFGSAPFVPNKRTPTNHYSQTVNSYPQQHGELLYHPIKTANSEQQRQNETPEIDAFLPMPPYPKNLTPPLPQCNSVIPHQGQQEKREQRNNDEW
jgi:hypothetical protein